ncbi:MAG: Periplasmic copper-binding protein (NosD) [Candidatus Argoarchaeum ethanivorans]|uniref:Periplasmic copper-binding protein (NosD) n=1 Tax=Candidatus Argoarchaeum ethanivorans TaxID=2608793 RepID=A0A811TCT9_9EURY|nr:MAG: Periplasmic copper-binding protein (NosD) [Candidatus Argoarchaeum ethanivorans]
MGSGNRPILYYNSSVTLENNDNISELILANADGSQINNVTVRGSDTSKNNGILLVRTDNSDISNSNSSNNDYGIYLYSSSNNNITNNNASSNNFGIYLSYSSNNMLTNNIASNNRYGVYLFYSSNNMLTNNIASNNRYGICLSSSSNNTLTNNTASNNNNGIFLWYSSNNTLYHNNLINNTNNNAYDTSTNQWNTSTVGNYYSDYTGSDSDGIGDTSYQIPGGSSIDHFPLMHPWGKPPLKGDLDGDYQITSTDAAIVLEIAVGSRPFDDAADVSGDGRVSSLDALVILQNCKARALQR